jgi:HSP20 family protein
MNFAFLSFFGLLTGLKKEDVRVSLENGNTLQILGHRQHEEIDKSDTWHRVERNHNSFVRRFHLPPNVHVDGMKTKVEHGVLTITVPKDKNYKPKPSSSIPIPVQWES